MNRNHDDDQTTQSRDAELDQNTERAAGPSGERRTDPSSAPEQIALQEMDGARVSPFQEFDEQAHHDPDPWSRGDERDDAELSTHLGARVPPKKTKRNRRLISAVALLVIIIGGVLALYYIFSPSRSVKINVKTKQPTQTQDAIAKSDKAPEDVTAEAIAEVRRAISNPSAAASPSTATSVLPRGAENLPAPLSSTVLPSDPSETPSDTKQHEASPREESRRNRERSIRFTIDGDQPAIRKVSLDSHPTDAASVRQDKTPLDTPTLTNPEASRQSRPSFVANASRKLSTNPSIAPVVLPRFGSILPVRTLGKIYTLRSGSSIRLELTRYVSGEGWSLSKGTVLIGQVSGSERDRAFIAITGFIEPSRDRFVNLAGETLGDDGGSGIRGKFHKLSSGWSRAFARVASSAVNVAGAVAGSRISGQPVIITDVGSRTISPFSSEVDSSLLNQARGFVEVPAGTAGFVMVTTLPADVKAVDAEPDHPAQFSDTTTASANQSGALTQEELAQLLTSGDTTRIREALPRLSPQMRRVAETVLAESAQKERNANNPEQVDQ
ncbi:MAG: hypothetical protein WAU45_16980 [Blastocatellia bacterium]